MRDGDGPNAQEEHHVTQRFGASTLPVQFCTQEQMGGGQRGDLLPG